jgi:FkbM family methyltransferase
MTQVIASGGHMESQNQLGRNRRIANVFEGKQAGVFVLSQNRWIAKLFDGKRAGYFVEIGAFDELYLSKTAALEKALEWTGVCVAPTRVAESLRQYRTCNVDNALIYETTGQAILPCPGRSNMGGVATEPGVIEPETLSLGDLLAKWNAPHDIDFLSLDTEGSELKIINAFSFERYLIKILTIKHNFEEPKRALIRKLCARHGLVRVKSAESNDWYLNRRSFSAWAITREIARYYADSLWHRTRNILKRVRRGVRRVGRAALPFAWGSVELKDVLQRYSPRGVLHIGAHRGYEAAIYESRGIRNVIWVEALPELAAEVAKRTGPLGHRCVTALVSDRVGEGVTFHISSNDMESSSMFPWGNAMENVFPWIHPVREVLLETTTIDRVFSQEGLDSTELDLLVLDVQGAELKVIRGMENSLRRFKWILSEYSTVPIYEGGVQLAELRTFLKSRGFRETFTLRHVTHGDTLFVRDR